MQEKDDYGYLRYFLIPNDWAQTDFFGNPVVGINGITGISRTFAIAGYGVILGYRNVGPTGIEMMCSIVVQGSTDTKVTLGSSVP
jgi:hypothetical protein